MDIFNIEGFYMQNNHSRSKLTGLLACDMEGHLQGLIQDGNKKQFASGYVIQKDAIQTLAIFIHNTRNRVANVFYSLDRVCANSETITGTYIGKRGALPYKILVPKDIDHFISSLDSRHKALGKLAQITLKDGQ